MADFDMEDELLDPAVIQAPGWVKEDGYDLPISPEKPAIHAKLQVVLDAVPLGSDHALIRERIGPYDTHIPIYPGFTRSEPSSNTHRSWLGALLMALFNLSPFLNFIEEAANNKAFNDHIIIGLHSMAKTFHRRSNDQLEDEELEDGIWSRLETFWQCIMTEGPNGVGRFWPNYCHVPEFLNYLFKRLERAQLRQGQAGGGDDVNLSTRFMQLFKYFTVRFTPMRCGCAKPVLRRQATGYPQSDGYILTVYVPEGMRLEQAISLAMRENETEPLTRTCPECGNDVDAIDFHKFAYLPEVFFIFPMFLSKGYDDGTYSRYTSDEKFIYPERLDMSALTDDPERPGDQTDRIYKLQSIVTCTDQTFDWTTSYKTSLRVSENEWVQYGYDADSGPSYPTFEEINDPCKRETSEEAPNLLMYVRDHHIEDSGILPDAVKPKQAPPQPNTEIHDSYGLESFDLGRFVQAQNQPGENENATAFENAKSELGKGRKTSHWMWYMFPQVLLDRASRLGKLFAIKSLGEAIAYWDNSLLRSRYMTLLQIILKSPQTDLKELFGEVDAVKLQASLTLFVLTCDEDERDLFRQVFKKFDIHLHEQTVRELIQWLDHAGERQAITWIEHYAGIKAKDQLSADHSGGDDGNQETEVPEWGGLSTLITSAENFAYDQSGYGDSYSVAGRKTLFELMRLAETEVDDSDEDASRVAEYNERGELLGKLLIGFAFSKGEVEPDDIPSERARLLGRNLMLLSKLAVEPDAGPDVNNNIGVVDAALDYENDDTDNDDPDDDLAEDDNIKPDSGYTPDDSYEAGDLRPSVDNFGLDGASESPDEGAHLNEEDPHEAVAIPTDPNDPRIEACQSWTLKKLKSEFQKEQIDRGGLRSDTKKHRIKFLKHFELERDYSIYHASRLRQAIEERGIVMSNGGTGANKADMVDALTEYDTQRLGEMEFVEDGTEETDSVGFEAEEYESSEAPEADTSSVNQATPRSKKRPRDEYEEDDDEIDDEIDEDEDYGDEDYDERDGEIEPRDPPKGPVRRRTRY